VRILLLYCHPRPDSFNAAIHARVLQVLREAGHTVDDCDLYAEGFDPVLSNAERGRYHEVPANREPVAAHVQRLLQAEGLILVFPVWNMGLPAMLKGFFDRVLLPGVSFDMSDPRRIRPGLTHLQHVIGVCTYGVPRWRAWWLGDAPRAVVQRFLRRLTDGRARVRYLGCYGLNTAGTAERVAFIERAAAAVRKIG
jgi:putative NADPH-quinone reductase